MKNKYLLLLFAALLALISCKKENTFKTLIITGQNNHNWQASSPVLKKILDETGLFSCDIVITPKQGSDMSSFSPDFSRYRLIVMDYNGDSWPEKTKTAFVDFVRNGGGLVIYHAADNSFPGWKEYNEMTGLGGWGDRNEKDGPYVYYKNGVMVTDTTPGIGGSHGARREFLVRTRMPEHPVMKGLPSMWLHGNDELYSQLRGPAKNMQILATAFADSAAGGGTMRDEPVLMAITYGKGRIFHTTMGHAEEGGGPAMQCAGFITTLQRGAEWAVTGDVTQAVPWDFPSVAELVLRPDFREITLDEALANIKKYEISKSTKYLTCIQAHIRSLAGNTDGLLALEKRMTDILKDKNATVDSKKLILREISWMGSSYSVPVIEELSRDPLLKDEAGYALERLQK